MFSTYESQRTLVADRHSRYEASARRSRILSGFRQHDGATPRSFDRATAPFEADGAARKPISLGRTPSEIEHRAA